MYAPCLQAVHIEALRSLIALTAHLALCMPACLPFALLLATRSCHVIQCVMQHAHHTSSSAMSQIVNHVHLVRCLAVGHVCMPIVLSCFLRSLCVVLLRFLILHKVSSFTDAQMLWFSSQVRCGHGQKSRNMPTFCRSCRRRYDQARGMLWKSADDCDIVMVTCWLSSV